MTNPILIEVTRGPLVESRHRGALAIARPDGSLVLAMGDVSSNVFPRSAIKALQSLQLIESGTAERFSFGDEEIALSCASHTGTQRHVSVAARMLNKIGLEEGDLRCGVHPPLGAKANKCLCRSGGEPTQLHNNCSGKHAGMLAVARHLNEPLEDYYATSHPVQQRVHALLRELSGLELGADTLGFDGCSLPNWAMPLQTMAHVFAKMVTGEGMSIARKAAFDTIFKACWNEPELIAGPSRTDTLVLSAWPEQVFIKTGAEGVYCGGFPQLGLGFALKVDDGATRASAGSAMAVVEHFLGFEGSTTLSPHAPRKVLKSWNGATVGEVHSSSELKRALAGIKL